jgi:hypothetical protein
MIKRIWLINAVLCLGLTAFAQTKDEVRPLPPEQSFEREITAGEAHAYRLPLLRGQFLRLGLEQDVEAGAVAILLGRVHDAGRVAVSVSCKSPACKAGDSIKPGVEQSATPVELRPESFSPRSGRQNRRLRSSRKCNASRCCRSAGYEIFPPRSWACAPGFMLSPAPRFGEGFQPRISV